LQKKPTSKSSDRVSEPSEINLDRAMPKKPDEIFEIRMAKVTDDKRQLFIALEIYEQSQTVLNSQT
jgi:hypothetical protein